MLPELLPVPRREQVALRPFVEDTVLEPKVPAVLVELYLAALRHVPKLVRIHVNVLRSVLQV